MAASSAWSCEGDANVCVHRRGGDGGVDASRSDARYQKPVERLKLRQRAVGPPLSAYSGWETPHLETHLNKLSRWVTPQSLPVAAVVSALCCSVPRVLCVSACAVVETCADDEQTRSIVKLVDRQPEHSSNAASRGSRVLGTQATGFRASVL